MRAVWGFGAAWLSLALAGPATAGVIVLRSGEVIVGRIAPETVHQGADVLVRWPYRQVRSSGELRVARERIRWVDPSDAVAEPTDAYWDRHADEPIDARYAEQRDRWRRLRAAAGSDEVPLDLLGQPLPLPAGREAPDALPAGGAGHLVSELFTVRLPDGWEVEERDGVTVLRSPYRAPSGFTPRVEIAWTRPGASAPEELVDGYLFQCRRSVPTGDFEVLERAPATPVADGVDQEVVTVTRSPLLDLYALRRVCVRGDRVFFVTAFAAPEDYLALERVLRGCVGSFRSHGPDPAPGR